MREEGDLKYNPVRFAAYGANGSLGEKDIYDMFRSPLVQNICYSVRNTAKTVNEIADDLGVSPVYVSGEASYLEEYGFLKRQGTKYLADFLIEEPTRELLQLESDTYKAAGELFASALYDELNASKLLESPALRCAWKEDRNFLLWALVPWIAACSGESLLEKRIAFDEVAAVRKDGGVNIFRAMVACDLPEGYESMNEWFGPCWNADEHHTLWQVGSEWSGNLQDRAMNLQGDASKTLALYQREQQEKLSVDEYAWLAERGLIRLTGEGKAEWQIVILDTPQLRDGLLEIGNQLREKQSAALKQLRDPYVKAVLENLPPHMRKTKEFENQFIFFSDGRFICHCLKSLLNSGKLTKPKEAQKKALSTLLMPV